ncbi:hypothetical protein MD484_g6757, partial [Candolleomyces efflorescens]
MDRLMVEHRFTTTTTRERSIYRVVHKLTNIVVAGQIHYPPIVDLVSSSEDAAETLINLWNVCDPDTGEPHFHDPRDEDAIAAVVDQLPLYIQRRHGEKTVIAVLERLSPSMLKKIVKGLEYRIRSVRTSDPRAASTVYIRLERLMLLLYSNVTFFYAVDRYVDWRCFTTILVQIYKDPNAFPPTSTMMEPHAIKQSPCAGLSHLVVWITSTGSGLQRRLARLFDPSDFASCKPGQRRQANTLMHLLALVFEWTARDERLSFMFKQQVKLLQPQTVYPPVAIAFYESYLEIPERHRRAMQDDPHCGNLWQGLVDTMDRRWSVYRQFAGNNDIGDVVYVCDNPNAQDWPRHRLECVDSARLHDELKHDHRWITPSLRQQLTVYLTQFASGDISESLLSYDQANQVYPGELDDTLHYMHSHSLITNQDTPTRKWGKVIVAGMLDHVRNLHFPTEDLRDLVFTIGLDFREGDVALETVEAFRESVDKSRVIAGWTKKRVGRILDQCAELNRKCDEEGKGRRREEDEDAFYVVFNVEAPLGTDMIRFVCLAEVRRGLGPVPCPQIDDGDVVDHHHHRHGELEFSVFHSFFFPSMTKSTLAQFHQQLNFAKRNYKVFQKNKD